MNYKHVLYICVDLDVVCYIDFNWRNYVRYSYIYNIIHTHDEKFGLLSNALDLPPFWALQHSDTKGNESVFAVYFSLTFVQRPAGWLLFGFFHFYNLTLLYIYIHTCIQSYWSNSLFPFFWIKIHWFSIDSIVCLCADVCSTWYNSLKHDKYFICIEIAKFSSAPTHPFQLLFICVQNNNFRLYTHKHRLLFWLIHFTLFAPDFFMDALKLRWQKNRK